MPNRVKTCLPVKSSPSLFLLITGFVVFCGISQLSRLNYPLFGLVVLVGIFFPLAWGGFTKNWKAIGFSRQNLGKAFFWGGLCRHREQSCGFGSSTGKSVCK